MPAAPDYAPSLAASGRRRPPQRATPKNSRLGFFGTPSGRTLAKRHSARRTAPGYRACGYKTASSRPKWLNRDPIGENGGLNLYAYAGNNPISGIDPLGLSVSWSSNADKQAVIATIGYLKQSPSFNAAWQQLINSSTNYVIGSDIPPPGFPLGDFQPGVNAIVFDPILGRQFSDGTEYPAFTFAHEVQHAIDSDNGVLNQKEDCPSKQNKAPYYAPNQAEIDAQNFKVKVANEIGGYANVQYLGPNWDPVVVPSPVPPK